MVESRSKKPTRTARKPRKRPQTPEPAVRGEAPDFDAAPVPMHEIDRDGIIRRVNRAECDLLGSSPEEMVGRHVSEFVVDCEREESREAVRRKISGEQPLAPFRREFIGRDGRQVTVEIREDLVRDPEGNVAGMRSALMDVSERHRAEERMRQDREELEMRVRERTRELACANEALRKEIAERRAAGERLAVQYAVTRVLADCDHIDHAFPQLLRVMGPQLGWDVGVCWTADPPAGALRFRALWPEPPAAGTAHDDMAARLRRSAFARGQALPGAVWQTGEPAWIADGIEPALGWTPEGEPACRSGLALPIVTRGGAASVIAFFSRQERSRDPNLLATAGLLGVQIGQFLDRKMAEAHRDRSEARFTAFMDNLPGVAFMKDPDGRYAYFNGAIRSMLGIEPGEALGKTETEIWPPEVAAALIEHDREVQSSGEASERVHHVASGNGAQRSWLVYKFPVPDSDGKPCCIGGVAMDVTERSVLEDQLRQSQKMDAIGRLAGGVAHDFNNLLTIIGGYGRMVLEQLGSNERARSNMEMILNAADRAAVLTSQLLAFSRRQVVQPKLLELNHVISNLEKMLRRVIGEHIVLRTVLDDRLARVKADAGQVEQIVMNLAINARDAMPDGGTLIIETANVSFRKGYESSRQSSPHVRLSVIDTGCGMDEQVRSRLFEPFFTTKGRGKGTGLGLSTVYGIVRQHGGEIGVDSEPGAGTRFHIYLPAVTGEPHPAPPEEEGRAPGRGTETILLVEDEAGVRRLARDILRASGYRVLEASDGQEALRVAERETGRIHLLLTDMIMPLMSGRELANRVQQMDKNVRVVFMSGYTDDVIAYHGELGPESDFLQKPFAPDVVARKVRDVLDKGKEAARTSRPERA